MAEKYPVNLQSDEHVIQLIRRHPIRVSLEILLVIIVTAVLMAILSWLGGLVGFMRTPSMVLMGLVLLGGVVAIGLDLYRYRNDIWLITNQRIVDSTKHSPFNHTLSTADLVNVQDINIHRRGLLATIFKFGDVSCQTASASRLFIFRGVGNPENVLEIVDANRDKARQR